MEPRAGAKDDGERHERENRRRGGDQQGCDRSRANGGQDDGAFPVPVAEHAGGNCASAYASQSPESARPTVPFVTPNSAVICGTSGLMTSRAAIVAANASVQRESTVCRYRQFTAEVALGVKSGFRSRAGPAARGIRPGYATTNSRG